LAHLSFFLRPVERQVFQFGMPAAFFFLHATGLRNPKAGSSLGTSRLLRLSSEPTGPDHQGRAGSKTEALSPRADPSVMSLASTISSYGQ
jgi:hypothetical protein